MSASSRQLLELLPAIHRIRDAEIAVQSGLDRGPLEELMNIIAEQIALMEENIEQLYDDQFIEIAKQSGYRSLLVDGLRKAMQGLVVPEDLLGIVRID